MKKLVIITLLLVMATAYADPADALEDKYINVLTKYKTEYDAKCRKLSKAYITQLEKLQVATVKRGDLDGALKIKAKITATNKMLKTHLPVTALKPTQIAVTTSGKDKVTRYVFMWPNGYVIDFQSNDKYWVYKTSEMYKNKKPFHTTNTWKKTKDNTYDLFYNGKKFMQTVVIATDKRTFKIIDKDGSTHTGVLLDKLAVN